MNDVGEPCAGEPHARFDRGPLGTRTQPCGGSWSRAGGADTPLHGLGGTSTAVLRSAEPAAYLTDLSDCESILVAGFESQPRVTNATTA